MISEPIASTANQHSDDTPPVLSAESNPSLFPALGHDEIALLSSLGQVRTTVKGEVLFRDGDPHPPFIVVLEGCIAVIDTHQDTEQTLGIWSAGQFFALMGMLTGQPAYATAMVRQSGSVVLVPGPQVVRLIDENQALGDLILRTILRRREALSAVRSGMRIIGSRHSPDTRRLREFVTRNRLVATWEDLDVDPHAAADLTRCGVLKADSPVVMLGTGKLLRNPTNAELALATGLRGRDHASGDDSHDVTIVGAGPAGLAAAVYAASNGLSTVLLDGVAGGGQAATAPRIENYLAFPSGLPGSEFAERALMQAEKFGARLSIPSQAVALNRDGDGRIVVALDDGRSLTAAAVIIACGIRYRQLSVPGLEEFEGAGVVHGTGTFEANLRPGETAVVVGGANSAGEAALALTAQGHHVFMIVRGHDLTRGMTRYLIDRVENDPAIEVCYDSHVTGVAGTDRLEHVTIESAAGPQRVLAANAMFVLIGAQPNTQWLGGQVTLDDRGFVVTGPMLNPELKDTPAWTPLHRDPYLLETSLPGVFAAGDVRSGSVKRVAPAAGEGAMAGRFAEEHLSARVA